MKKMLFVFGLFFSLNTFAQSTWKVVYVWDGMSMTNVKTKKSDFVISIPDKKITGTFGCNAYSGNFEYAKGDQIKPIKIVQKKENCPEKVDLVDKHILTAFKIANKVVLNQDKAKFYNGTTLVMEMDR